MHSEYWVYVNAIVVVNKKDLVSKETLDKTSEKIQKRGLSVYAISAKNTDGLDELRSAIFSHLNLTRIFMKPVGKKADYVQPLILKEGTAVGDACKKLHRDFQKKFRYAMVWGSSAKHAGQKVGLDHKLKDEDILTIVTWK